MEALARRLNEDGVSMSASQVWRICKSLDPKPVQTESWMTSHDPDNPLFETDFPHPRRASSLCGGR